MTVLMANSDGRSTGIVVDPRTDVAQALSSSVFQSGSIGLVANSGQELFELLNTNPDIDFILITDSNARPHYQELVQQLRGFWLSRKMPIALLVRNDDRERQAERIFDRDPLSLVLPLTRNPKLNFNLVSRLRDLRQEVVADTQRNQHSKFALDWLSKLLTEQDVYRFYHLISHKEQLVGLTRVPADYDLKSSILAGLGTSKSQLALVDLAGDVSLTNQQRQLMAAAFAESAERYGVLFSPSDIKLQYQRYNSNADQSEDSQKILGSILDTIEARLAGS